MNPALKTKRNAVLAALLGAVALGAIFQAPLRWTAQKIHRGVFPEQNPERPVYDDTAKAPVNLATFVQDERKAWPQADLTTVHAVTLEVATGLLMHPDIEVGSMERGTFVPWRLAPWQAAARIHEEVGGMPGFLSDPSRYVFRRKTT